MKFLVSVEPTSPRGRAWQALLGSHTLPVRGLLPEPLVIAPDGKVEDFYALDLDALSLWQRARLVRWVADREQLSLTDAAEQLSRNGFHLLAKDVLIETEGLWFL